jgi:hypothetical protein
VRVLAALPGHVHSGRNTRMLPSVANAAGGYRRIALTVSPQVRSWPADDAAIVERVPLDKPMLNNVFPV